MDDPTLWQCILTLTCSVAVTFNAILLVIIFRYSTSEIKVYKYFLANLTLADLIAALLFLLLIPYPTIGKGAYGGVMLGPAKIFKYVNFFFFSVYNCEFACRNSAVSNWVFILLVVAFCYCTIALVLTFVYRYIVLCDVRTQQRFLSKRFVYFVAGMLSKGSFQSFPLIIS